MKSMLPQNLLPKIERAFFDFELEFEKDVQDATLLVNEEKGSCFLMHKYVDEMNSGTLICTFHKNGFGFTWGKPYLHYFED